MKKSSYSKKIVKLLKKEYKEDLEKSKIKNELNSSANSKYETNRILLVWQNDSPVSVIYYNYEFILLTLSLSSIHTVGLQTQFCDVTLGS